MKQMTNNELFKGTAYYYSKYHADYPPEFFNYIIRYFGLDGKGRLLDLGCGTGQLTIPFAKYFEEVIGLDPEQEMLDEAERQVNNTDIKNVKFVLRRAEDVMDDLERFRLITMGASFHWMNQVEVLQKIYDLIETGGGVVIVGDSTSPWRDENEEWKKVRKEVVQKYLGEKRRAGNTFFHEPKGKYTDLLKASPFGGYEEWTFNYTRTGTIEAAVNFLYSTSLASRRLFGDRLKDFEQELRTELLKLEPSGVFKEPIHVQALLARK